MNIKTLVVAITLAFSTSVFASGDCGITNPCPAEQSPDINKQNDLLPAVKNFFSGVAGKVAKGSTAVAEALKETSPAWPQAAESASVQMFPAYPFTVACYRHDVEAMGTPQDDQGRLCAEANKKLRGTFYRYIVLAPEPASNSGNMPAPQQIAESVNVVLMPSYADSVTCWRRDVESDGAKDCQALRASLRGVSYKYLVIPDARTRAIIARAGK